MTKSLLSTTPGSDLLKLMGQLNQTTGESVLRLQEYAGSPSVTLPLGVGHDVLWRAVAGYQECYGCMVWLVAYTVLSYTPCGAWVEIHGGKKKRWVDTKAHRQFASVDRETAIKKLHERKGREVRILRNRFLTAKEELKMLDDYYANES